MKKKYIDIQNYVYNFEVTNQGHHFSKKMLQQNGEKLINIRIKVSRE